MGQQKYVSIKAKLTPEAAINRFSKLVLSESGIIVYNAKVSEVTENKKTEKKQSQSVMFFKQMY